MILFQDEIASGLDEIYIAAGVEALFTDVDGKETAVTALVNYDLQFYGDTADITAVTAAVSVRKTEIALSPRRGARYKIGLKTYIVDSVVTEDELEHVSLVA